MKRSYIVAKTSTIVACYSLLAACAAGSLGTRTELSGNPSCVSAQSASLADPIQGGATGVAQVSRPQPIGGILSVDALVPRSTEVVTVVGTKFSELKFGGSATCSVALEFRKVGSSYFADALLDSYCSGSKLTYKGRNPVIMVSRSSEAGVSAGYERLSVELPELNERDRVLKTLENIPDVNEEIRLLFIANAFVSERLLSVRRILANMPSESPDSGLGKALCVAIPDAEIQAFASNPNATPSDDPRNSGKPRPIDCQMMTPSRWVTFEVPAQVAAAKGALLDGLVKQTDTNRQLSASSPNLDAAIRTALADFRKLDAEAFENDIKRLRLRLAFSAIRAANGGCVISTSAAGTAQNKILAGPSRNAYIELSKTLVSADLHPLIDRLRGHQCTEDDDSRAYRAKIAAATAASDAKFLELARVLGQLQSLMKAKKEQVGIATNHIRNLTGSEVAIEFKDLPLFPTGASVATELQRHTFNFNNPWLSATFDRAKAHPGANNLRTDFNDGYAITFGGVPVGAVSAMTDESGGVAAIPLPERKPVAAKAPSSDPNGNAGPGEAERNRADQKSVPVADCK